jgi:hypothetical protein
LFVNSATRKKIPLASASGQGFMVNNKKLSRRYIRAGYSAMGKRDGRVVASADCRDRKRGRDEAALLAEASLSFLGLVSSPPNPSWGAMLARAYQYMEIAPEQMYAPGLAILVVSLAFNALGESLRIVLDPTMKDR